MQSLSGIHFQSDIINSNELKKKLRSLSNSVTEKYTENEEAKVLDIYEKTFCHNEFTGRANTFYKYEGLGSTYWHMVSKLLLAVQEVYFDCENKSCDPGLLKKIKNFYYDIKDGIGAYRQPSEFGAFPTDPYSHTPSFAGAQQPGMTGQVKEDIISRFGEVGIKIKSGKIFFNTSLLKQEEFLDNEEDFTFCDLNGKESEIICKKKSFVITYCQVPFIYKISNTPKIVVLKETGEMNSSENLELEEKFSQSIFNREGKIKQVEVYIDNRIFNS
jgi:hypothetical protein